MQNQDQNIQEKFHIPDDYQGQRLDQTIAKLLPQYSRACLQRWIKNGHVLLNNATTHSKYKVRGGESVEINAPLEVHERWEPQSIALEIVYEDDALLVVNKPAGLVVHPAAGNYDGTLVNALLHHIPASHHLPRAGIVHRLDKETSGLLLVAKTLKAHHALVKALQARKIHREYQCLVQGSIISGGTIDQAIGRHPHNRLKRAILDHGKPAVTHYRLIKRYKDYTHLQVFLETGRTHQIRVHLASIHHPLLGDSLYAGRLKMPKSASPELKTLLENFKRQALHARKLIFNHPITGLETTVTCEAPADYLSAVNILDQENTL
jgi:23S rRNA pseudouridine1911/1915/1917 synthase